MTHDDDDDDDDDDDTCCRHIFNIFSPKGTGDFFVKMPRYRSMPKVPAESTPILFVNDH